MRETNQGNQPITSLALALFLAPILYLAHSKKRTDRRRDEEGACLSFLSDPGRPALRPPLPPIVRRVLSRCRLAYLSTVDADASSSHLSLMRFTYLPEEEVIVMSTNRKTKKFDMLSKQRGVALLVHDFCEGGKSGEYTITLNGICSIVNEDITAERYRAAHIKNNPDYPQFIIGEDIAMLCVDVGSARICNINDQVIKWNVES